MSVLLDTNILSRLVQPSHPHHVTAKDAVSVLQNSGEDLCLVPQNMYEFWTVATRPVTANGGLGMTPAAAERMLHQFEGVFALRPDPSDLYPRWKLLVTGHATIGKGSHDARLVAAMEAHRISDILTFNVGDFSRYPGITPIDPSKISPASSP